MGFPLHDSFHLKQFTEGSKTAGGSTGDMLVAIYSALKAPKVAGSVWLAIGCLLGSVGAWGAFAHPGLISWFLIGLGGLMAGTGWLLLGGIK